MDEILKEEFLKVIEEAKESLLKLEVREDWFGTREKPKYCYVSNVLYEAMKPYLDDDMFYHPYYGLCKVINVDKTIQVEVKHYEVEKENNPFCNTFKKPFYRDVFEKNKNDYAVKVLGKWSKKK